MKKIRTLLVVFENEVSSNLISAFRGAIISKVGFGNQAFHNHSENGFLYKYPEIQYKIISKKAALYCIGNGVDEIHNFFGLRSWEVQLHDKKLDLKIDRLDLNTFNFNIWDKYFQYHIRDWLALNEKNYKTYHQLSSLKEKISLLEKLLVGNILSFAKGIGWHIDKPVKVEIRQLKGQKMIRYKGVPLIAFDVDFSSNVFLPNYLGLGKSASHGFGVVRMERKKINEEKNDND
ncbi:MAG: hypothetical protein J0H55_05105 [Chitinophagaceae bacterium]|nr:hypothetical protein [Chitinophagaceae bacterium]